MHSALLLCAALGVLLLGSLVAVIALGALGVFGQTSPDAADARSSLITLVGTTLRTSIVALVLAGPIGLFAALYLTEFASPRMRGWLESPLQLLVRVPPIVYGYFSAATFLPALGKVVPGLNEQPSVSAGIALAGMLVPCFLEQGRAAVGAVPQSLRDGACALGAGKFATAWFVVLPAARTRLLTGLVVAASRAMGEAMLVLVVFTAFVSRQTTPPRTLTTFFIPYPTRSVRSGAQIPREFFIVGCALLLLAFLLDAIRMRLDKPPQGDLR